MFLGKTYEEAVRRSRSDAHLRNQPTYFYKFITRYWSLEGPSSKVPYTKVMPDGTVTDHQPLTPA